MSMPQGLEPISTENAREIVDAIDDLIKLRIAQSQPEKLTATAFRVIDEQCEGIKRRVIDYLLVSDARVGVFQTGRRDR